MYVVFQTTPRSKVRVFILRSFRTIEHALDAIEETHGLAHFDVDFDEDGADAIDFAGRTYCVEQGGACDLIGTTIWVPEVLP